MLERKNRCVYSAITGNYDFVREVKHKSPDYEYILFTNNKELKSNTWDIRYVDNPDELSDTLLARQIKLQYWKYVSEYDISIWVDGNIEICGRIEEFIKSLPLELSDLFVSNHPHRNNILEEAQTCLQLNKETKENLLHQINVYKSENMPFKNIPLIESGVLVRKSTKKIQKFCDFWFKQLLEYTPRDQIAFAYTLWKNPVAIFLYPSFRDNYKNVFRLSWNHGSDARFNRVW